MIVSRQSHDMGCTAEILSTVREFKDFAALKVSQLHHLTCYRQSEIEMNTTSFFLEIPLLYLDCTYLRKTNVFSEQKSWQHLGIFVKLN